MEEVTDALPKMVLEVLCTKMSKLMFCVSETLWSPLAHRINKMRTTAVVETERL